MKPATNEPAMPRSIVMMMPPGSRPGMNSLARAPTMRPTMSMARMCMCPPSLWSERSKTRAVSLLRTPSDALAGAMHVLERRPLAGGRPKTERPLVATTRLVWMPGFCRRRGRLGRLERVEIADGVGRVGAQAAVELARHRLLQRRRRRRIAQRAQRGDGVLALDAGRRL